MRIVTVTVLISCAFALARAASGAPLDQDTCDKLMQQQTELEHAGVRAWLTKGVQAAKSSLSPEQLQQVRRLIDVDEQVEFRCMRMKPLPPESVVAQPLPVEKAKPLPRVKSASARTKTSDEAEQAPAEAVRPAPRAKPKAAPKPKPATDAYVPAPGTPGPAGGSN